ncbi:NAD(P)-dependent oxidoreductase [Bailinhaonella thermotolerans]|uniref:NAD(P)-dependent oxidoreductase n=1 Tax=Bailinhaonella thermotolerans TaxID=1070861 RepID=A0A3A4AXP4_9ACTN|nr:NAD(P)-binding domain-containing protein [Bailinhaonella thermotolerans]RJL32174.1 NAD(P)-dependent oxidoreductase [Bailinhaonella thermotolerans]
MRETDVTVLGLGLMGQAIAGAFLKGGREVTVWNRTAAKADALVAQGAQRGETAAEAVGASGLVVVVLTDYTAVTGVLEPLADTLAGRTVVNLTSGTAAQAREFAEWAAKRDITYLDGAIMAIPQVVGTDDAFLLYGGAKEVYDAHEAVLRDLGASGTIHLGADHGLASLYDVALLGIMWGTLNSFLHGAALVGTAGVDAKGFSEFANKWIGAITGFVSAYAAQIDEGSYTALDASIDTHAATVDHLIEESEAAGVNAEVPKLVKSFTDRARAEGHGLDSYAAMITQFRRP